jgi:two-component system, OmpR family, KDP operon response regulator KdpE
MSARILIVDDEFQIRRALRNGLAPMGYEVLDAEDGSDALVKFRSARPDLILLDLNMPVMDGLETCRLLRVETEIPIIVLSVRNTEREKVDALDAGADDYITKPFGMGELLARIRVALRRLPMLADVAVPRIKTDDFDIDFTQRRLLVHGQIVRLRPKEFDLFWHLAQNANRPISHRKLIQLVWGPDYGDELVYLRVLVNQLRGRIEPDVSRPRYIVTEPRIGYRFVVPESALNPETAGDTTSVSPPGALR